MGYDMNDWGPENAGVVCRQLGFPVTGKTIFVCCHHGGGGGGLHICQ